MTVAMFGEVVLIVPGATWGWSAGGRGSGDSTPCALTNTVRVSLPVLVVLTDQPGYPSSGLVSDAPRSSASVLPAFLSRSHCSRWSAVSGFAAPTCLPDSSRSTQIGLVLS